MELMNTNTGDTQKFTSVYLTEQINVFRKEEGKSDLRHSDLIRKIELEFEDEINERKISSVNYLDKKGQQRKCYDLDFEESLQLLMSESKKVRKQVVAKLKQLQSKTPTTYLQALEVLIKTEKEKQLLELKNENLETVLDNLLEWVSIVKIANHNKVSELNFNWRLLKSKSKELGYKIKKAESPRFGYQNLYHIDSFKAVYPQYDYDLMNKKKDLPQLNN